MLRPSAFRRTIWAGTMASIFLSYAREDLGVAKSLAGALERLGHSVWWDRQIKGGTQFAAEIEAALAKAEAVIVLWSRSSIGSPWVRDEASAARDSGRLVPASVDGAQPPMGFRQYQSVDLAGWKGRRSSSRFGALVEAIDGVLSGAGTRERVEGAPVAPRKPIVSRRLASLAAAAALLIVLAVGVLYLYQARRAAKAPIAMAVMPFDALPADPTNTPFAQGLSEEILDELARNPRLRLVGRSSAAMYADNKFESRTIGRKLGVAYLLDGTVRRSGNQVRVAVELVRASDGVQLWRHTYNGTLNDIFAIQDGIGQSVEGQLRATFVGKEGVTARSLATRGDVYAYYLTARSLIRDREPAKMDAAVELLRKAIKIDPNYAPALAELGLALHFQRGMALNSANSRDTGMADEAVAYARKALALAPKLAEAHVAYAVAASGLGNSSLEPEIQRHMKIATELNPNDAENWNQLAQNYAFQGYFERTADAYRKAIALDPLWWMPNWNGNSLLWDLGYRDEAVANSRRFGRDADPQPFQRIMADGDVPWWRGDLSGVLKSALDARKVADPGRRRFTEMGMSHALYSAGYLAEARKLWHFYEVDEPMWQMWNGKAPTAALVRQKGWRDEGVWLSFALPTLLNEGRAAGVVQIYDGRFRSPESLADNVGEHIAFVYNGAHLVLALRQVGRNAEADRLLGLIDQSMAERLRGGRVPPYYLYLRATVLTLRGRTNEAIATLQQAERQGFRYAESWLLQDWTQEPLLRPLHGDRRFQAIVARELAWKAKERREIAPMLAQIGTP